MMQSHTGCICLAFLRYDSSNNPQIACKGGCIVTLAAFILFFSTVHFQMCSQRARIRGGKVTLVAFVRLFSAVCFQMFFQSACIR